MNHVILELGDAEVQSVRLQVQQAFERELARLQAKLWQRQIEEARDLLVSRGFVVIAPEADDEG